MPTKEASPFIGTFITHSPEETFALAERLAREISAPTVILLIGDLGAGKTIFAKGVAAGLGIDPDEVTSPSFTFVSHYVGRLKLYHVDLYRLEDPRAIYDHLGIDEILADRAVVVIEWAEKLGTLEVGSAYRVEMTWVDETTREVTIQKVDA